MSSVKNNTINSNTENKILTENNIIIANNTKEYSILNTNNNDIVENNNANNKNSDKNSKLNTSSHIDKNRENKKNKENTLSPIRKINFQSTEFNEKEVLDIRRKAKNENNDSSQFFNKTLENNILNINDDNKNSNISNKNIKDINTIENFYNNDYSTISPYKILNLNNKEEKEVDSYKLIYNNVNNSNLYNYNQDNSNLSHISRFNSNNILNKIEVNNDDLEESQAGREPIAINPKEWTVSTYRSCEGGGTGLEFTTNLQVPGDGCGNKWYDPSSGETWIQCDFKDKKKGHKVRIIALKSANDCPERDPSKIVFYGKSLNQKSSDWVELSIEEGIEWQDRYEFQSFYIPHDTYTSIKIVIKENKIFTKEKHWGSGTQLCEVVLYE